MVFITNYVSKVFDLFRSPTSYLYYGHIILYFGLVTVYLIFAQFRKKTNTPFKNFFSKTVYGTPQAVFEYKLVGTILLLQILMGFVSLTVSEKVVSDTTSSWIIGKHSLQPPGGSIMVSFLYSIGLLFFTDGAFYAWHRLNHRVGYLWNIHKMHHVVTQLNFVTSLRNHPAYTMGRNLLRGIVAGLYVAVIYFCLGYKPNFFTVMNIGVLHLGFTLLVYFSHTPLSISFGPLNYIFVSPALHQIHHSIDPKHHNCNYAIWFSLWDWIGGTLCLPNEKQTLTLGISDDQWGQRRYNSIWGSLIDPLLPDRFIKSRSETNQVAGQPNKDSAA